MIGTHNLKALHELVIPVKRSPQSEEPFNFVRITSVTNKNDDQINFLFVFVLYSNDIFIGNFRTVDPIIWRWAHIDPILLLLKVKIVLLLK